MKIFYFHFTWICNNNIVEYKALYLGLSKVISMEMICLIVYEDSKLVINKVWEKISAKHHNLKTYKNIVWDLLEPFIIMNMIAIPRKYNQITNAIARRGARLNPIFHKIGGYGVKFLCRSFLLDTANFW